MRSLLEQLENNEAVLLMYLAGELPLEDREEVDQQLAVDAGLRRDLESLKALHGNLTSALAMADDLAVPASARAAMETAAVRRVSRAMVQYRVEQSKVDTADESPVFMRSLRLPSWSYPFAAAAMILIGWVAYWGFSNTGGPIPRDHPELVESSERPEMPNSEEESASSANGQEDSGHHRSISLPSMAVDEGDMNLVAISAGSYEVSSMFQPVKE